MLWGMPWGAPWGDPETWVITLEVSDFQSGASITFLAVFAQYYQLVVDGRVSGAPVYVNAGATATLTGSYALNKAPHTITVVGCGKWATANLFDPTMVQTAFLDTRPQRIHFEVAPTLEQWSLNDGGQLTNWNITGLQRFTNCRASKFRTTWAELDFTLITSAGLLHTLTLMVGKSIVAQGSRYGNGTITLTERNNSGVCAHGTNTVDLVYQGEVTDAPQLVSDLGQPVVNEAGEPVYAGSDFPPAIGNR